MTGESAWALQQSVYAALIGDSPLMNRVSGIFDHVPAGQDPPYVTIGEATARRWSTQAQIDGRDTTLTIHVWSRYRGRKEAGEIMADIDRIRDRAQLSMTGHAMLELRFEGSLTLQDPDGITQNGVMRFRTLTYATA